MKNCPVCSQADSYLFCQKNGFDYVQCHQCHHIYLKQDVPTDLFESYQRPGIIRILQQKSAWDYSDQKYNFFYLNLLKRIEQYADKGKLLDFGCGNGSFVHAARRRGWESFGIELNEEFRDYAERFDIKIFINDLSKQGFADHEFDVITMWQVLEHIDCPGPLLEEIFRILKPNGILAVSTPNIDSIAWKILRERWGAVDPPVHPNLFNCASLRKLVEQSGFDSIRLETLDVKPTSVKLLFHRKGNFSSEEYINTIPQQTSHLSAQKIKIYSLLRSLFNIPLNLFQWGEDIYAYFRKPGAS